MSHDDADLSTPTKLDDRRAPDPDTAPAISAEPLVEPPSPGSVPIAMVKERGWIVAVVALLLAGLALAWRRTHSD